MITRGRPIQIRIFGVPEPMSKKQVGRRRLKDGSFQVTVPFDQDYRIRKNPITGKVERWDQGYKKRWVRFVQATVLEFMRAQGLKPFPKNHPIAMGVLLFMPKAKSNKLLMPSIAPDFDNMKYPIWNGLKRTPKKKGRPGLYPEGILFYEDDQIVWTLQPDGMVWATESCPPGVLITVQSALPMKEEILSYSNQGIEHGLFAV